MSVFGYESQEAFEKAVDAELEQRAYHEHHDGARPGQHKPKAQPRARRQPDTKTPYVGPRVTGKAGSPEREAAVRAINPDLYDQAKAEQSAAQISMLLDAWAQSDVDGYDAQVMQELARLTWETQSAEMFQAVRGAIENISGDTDYYDSMIAHRVGVEAQRQQSEYEQHDQKRVEDVQAGLQREYEVIERDLGPAGLLAADEVAQTWGEELYDPEVDADSVRVGLRAAAEMGRGQEYVGNVFRTHQTLSEEMRRVGAPGSSWNDAEREKWEAEMQQGDLETALRADERLNDPDAVTARALRAHAVEKSGTTPFMAALSEELDKLSADPPHRQALRDANVEAWEKSHDTNTGQETSDRAAEMRR